MDNENTLPPLASENWFPYTKLQAPQPGSNHVTRMPLQQALADAVHHHKLTLIAAPAGSGKTNLISSLCHSGLPTAWVALDKTDNDLPIFAALLATALGSWLPDNSRSLFAFLQSVPNLPEKTAQLAALFINSLRPEDGAPIILILDDYHLIIDPVIHQFINHLLEHLPPSLRLLIATRHDPPLLLPRLRARGQLAEIRLPQLRFDEEETAVLLNQRHQLNLTPGEITALQQQTAGWAAGLQLLAAVLASFDDAAERARYIYHPAPANRSIFDLLAAEVLAHQPPDLQEFLQQTSILPELTPVNCRAISENPDAPRLLTTVYQRNLFLYALSPDHNGPFRYHDLFRDFLQQQLKKAPQQWVELHRRAAQSAVNDEQKLHHLISAELWEEAAQLLEAMARLDTERRFTRSSVVSGIERLPADVRRAHPWLLLFVAQYYTIRGQLETAAPWRAQAATRFRETGDELGEIELLVIRAMADTDDSDDLINAFRQKAATSSHLMRPDHWAIYRGGEQWYALAQYDWAAVTEHTQANIQHALNSGDPDVLAMTSLTIGPQQLFCEGGIAMLESFASQGLQAARLEDWILQLCAQGLLGAVRFFQGRLDEAEQASRESHRLLDEIGGLAWIDHHVCWAILATLLARRAYRSFDKFLAAQAPRWQTQDTAVVYQQGMMYLNGRSLWLRGRTAEAQDVLMQMQAGADPARYDLDDNLRRLLLASLIAMARGETSAAKRDLRQAIDLHEKVRHTIMLTHPRLTLATLYGQQNRWTEALDELLLVLRELKVQQMPGVILQEGESIVPVLRYAIGQGVERGILEPLLHILQPDDVPQTISLPNSDSYLTPRESEVLRLLATGATNPAIAAELFITERTVKAHVTRILAKLDATTRTEAVTKASQLGLI
jgi:LuxR family maltose regulon positive regulatory protein